MNKKDKVNPKIAQLLDVMIEVETFNEYRKIVESTPEVLVMIFDSEILTQKLALNLCKLIEKRGEKFKLVGFRYEKILKNPDRQKILAYTFCVRSWHMFDVELKYRDDLQKDTLSDELKIILEQHGIKSLQTAKILERNQVSWVIYGCYPEYYVKDVGQHLEFFRCSLPGGWTLPDFWLIKNGSYCGEPYIWNRRAASVEEMMESIDRLIREGKDWTEKNPFI